MMSSGKRGQAPKGRSSRSDCRRRLDDRPELGALVLDGDRVPDHGAGEAALGGQGQALEENKAARLPDPLLEFRHCLSAGGLRRDEPENDHVLVGDRSERWPDRKGGWLTAKLTGSFAALAKKLSSAAPCSAAALQ